MESTRIWSEIGVTPNGDSIIRDNAAYNGWIEAGAAGEPPDMIRYQVDSMTCLHADTYRLWLHAPWSRKLEIVETVHAAGKTATLHEGGIEALTLVVTDVQIICEVTRPCLICERPISGLTDSELGDLSGRGYTCADCL